MRTLDKILKQLQDTQWHSIDETKQVVSMPSDTLNEVLSFLHEQAFIKKEDEKLKITSLGLKLLLL